MLTKRKQIGQLLVEQGAISEAQLQNALEGQRNSGNRLLSELLVRGFVGEDRLLRVLSDHAGVPGIAMGTLVLPLKYLDAVPESTALSRSILPVRADKQRIFLAMTDPHDEKISAEVGFLCRKQILPCVALEVLLQRSVKRAYQLKKEGCLEYRGGTASSEGPSLDFVYAEELTHIPGELSTAAPGERSAPEEEILFDLEGDEVAGEVEVSVEQPEKQLRVLVVEDDEKLRNLVCRLLRGEGMLVDEAGRGLEALSQVRKSPPDLLILDAMLPEVHGFDIAQKIRSSERFGHIPIIMVSSVYRGWRIASDLKQAYNVDAFLEKPFKIGDLASTVKRVLAQRRKRRITNPRMTAHAARKARKDGIDRYQAGDIAGAIECLQDGIRIDPLSATLHFQLGVLYLKKKGMVFQAIREFEDAVAIDPTLFAALRSLAILYQRKGFRNKAIDMWERALQCCPDVDTHRRIRNHLLHLIEAK